MLEDAQTMVVAQPVASWLTVNRTCEIGMVFEHDVGAVDEALYYY